MGVITCAKLRKAMLLLLGLLGGANATLLINSINTLLTYFQANSSLLFTSNDTIANITNVCVCACVCVIIFCKCPYQYVLPRTSNQELRCNFQF